LNNKTSKKLKNKNLVQNITTTTIDQQTNTPYIPNINNKKDEKKKEKRGKSLVKSTQKRAK